MGLCAGSAKQIPAEQKVVVVHGDLFTSDTRSALQVLHICEVDFQFKAVNSDKSPLASPASGFDSICRFTPVIEHLGRKNVGSAFQILIICAMNDQRNKPKIDSRGKLVKIKKGTPPAKSLYPQDYTIEMNRLVEWFNQKMKPYTQHLFTLILEACNFQLKN